MKISELRTLLSGASIDGLKRTVVELYRILPKKLREDVDVADLLTNPAAGAGRKRAAKEDTDFVSIDGLADDVEQFLADAYAQNYFAPNRAVPKSERPKWRFKVKRFFNEINAVIGKGAPVAEASELMEKLYRLLCYACDRILFSGDDPFESVGIKQPKFFDAMLALKAQHLELREFIECGLCHLRDSSMNRYTLPAELSQAFVEHLRTPDAVELAITRSAELHAELKPSSGRNVDYKNQSKLERLADFGFLAYVRLSDYDRGIAFLQKHYDPRKPERVLYVLLQWLRTFKRKDLWLREYERAIDAGATPRDSLRAAYGYLKEHGEFSAY